MNTDTAILMLLADLQRQIEALRAENAALREAAAKAPTPSYTDANPHENVQNC